MNGPEPVRRLPFAARLDPGQTFESLIESMAIDYHVSVTVMLRRLDITAERTTHALLNPDATTIAHLADACDLDIDQIRAATLGYYRDVGVAPSNYGRSRSATAQWTLFTRDSGARFCPACLTEKPCVTPVTWHLQWTFVCHQHQAVLVDRCPQCAHVPRSGENRRTHRLQPWRCQNVIRSGGTTSREVCGFDLRDAEPTPLGTGHPLFVTQAWIDGLIGTPRRPSSATTRVCGIDVPRIETLRALSQLLRRMVLLRVDTIDAVTHNLGTPRRITTGVTPPPGDAPAQSILAATVACAARFGEAATMAVDCLAAPTLARAAHEIARYADLALSKTPREDMTDRAADWRSDTPRVQTRHRAGLIDAIDLAGQELTPSDQLTFRVHNRIPRRPLPSTVALPTWPHTALTGLTARHIPQRLWPNVIAALPQSTHKDTGAFPTVAAMMLARIGTYTRWSPIALQLALPSTFARTPQSVMARLIDHNMFAETAMVLDALRECLDDTPPPINYARRRWIFRKLIDPGRGWRQACRDADIVATDRRRMFLGHALYELLTGSDARFRTHQPLPAGEIRVAYKHFLALEARSLHKFLRHKAESLLLRHRIDEPIQWAPSFDYDDGWRSPTPDLERHLPGWTSPSRTDTLRQSSRDHTTHQVLDTLTTGGYLDHILTDIIAHQRTGTLVHGPTLDVAIADLYQVTHQQWTLGAVGNELQRHLIHIFGPTIDLDLWEPRAHPPTRILPQQRPA